MLFAVDVGNTNITVGLFEGKTLIKQFRMITQISRTSDEYGVFLREWLEINGVDGAKIDSVVISSVVPAIMHSLVSGIIISSLLCPVLL